MLNRCLHSWRVRLRCFLLLVELDILRWMVGARRNRVRHWLLNTALSVRARKRAPGVIVPLQPHVARTIDTSMSTPRPLLAAARRRAS